MKKLSLPQIKMVLLIVLIWAVAIALQFAIKGPLQEMHGYLFLATIFSVFVWMFRYEFDPEKKKQSKANMEKRAAKYLSEHSDKKSDKLGIAGFSFLVLVFIGTIGSIVFGVFMGAKTGLEFGAVSGIVNGLIGFGLGLVFSALSIVLIMMLTAGILCFLPEKPKNGDGRKSKPAMLLGRITTGIRKIFCFLKRTWAKRSIATC